MISPIPTLASAFQNATSVLGHTDTQYLNRQFEIVSDVAQRASFQDLAADLQTIFHRCRKEAKSTDSAKRILITLSLIASKQASPKEKLLFSKVQAVVLQALGNEAQIGAPASRAKFFQDRLTLLLYARETMISQAVEAHTGLTYIKAIDECAAAFDNVTTPGSEGRAFLAYKAPEDLSTLAVSVLFRIQSLCEIEGDRRKRPLTRDEIRELEGYCQHEDPEVRKIATDFALLRKRIAANCLFSNTGVRNGELLKIGDENDLLNPSFPGLIAPYYPAYEKFVRYEMDQSAMPPSSLPQEQVFAARYEQRLGIYEEHLAQMPVLNFAYSYFYNELMELSSAFSSRVTFTKTYKKAYGDRHLPTPEEFHLIAAEFPKPISLSALEIEVEKREEKENKVAPTVQQRQPSRKKKKPPQHHQSRAATRHAEIKRVHSPSPDHVVSPKVIKLTELEVDSSDGIRFPVVESASPVAVEAATAFVLPRLELERDELPFDELVYDPRVSMWFTNPEDCLALPQYAPLETSERDTAVWKHAFSDALDQLIGTEYSMPEPWQNRTRRQIDLLYSIPGEVEYVGSSRRVRGLFQYCFGSKDNVCYHRCFKEMGMRDLVRHEYAKAFEIVDFPPLSSLATPSPAPVKPKPDVLVHEPALNTYAVKDTTRNIIFRAFKIRNLD